jgi:hypothetical protein
VSPPVGPTGISYCGDEATHGRFGFAYGYSWTRLKFDKDVPLGDTTKHSFALVGEERLSERWSLQASLGAVFLGQMAVAGTTYDVRPGPLFSVGASWLAVSERHARPFVLFGFSLGAAFFETHARGAALGDQTDTMSSFDGRVGVAIGKTLGGAISPYLAARAFGGPVYWTYRGESTTGTDAHHYQLGVGLVVHSREVGDVMVEVIPLGEGLVSVGGGVSF